MHRPRGTSMVTNVGKTVKNLIVIVRISFIKFKNVLDYTITTRLPRPSFHFGDSITRSLRFDSTVVKK